MKKPQRNLGFFICGEYGIRTHEGLHPTNFPSWRHRPLGEFSWNAKTCFAITHTSLVCGLVTPLMAAEISIMMSGIANATDEVLVELDYFDEDDWYMTSVNDVLPGSGRQRHIRVELGTNLYEDLSSFQVADVRCYVGVPTGTPDL